jgi:hypothetical protein
MIDITIRHEVRGCHHRQMDCTLRLLRGAQTIGWIDYAEFEETPSIQMIEVVSGLRRRGYATALLAELQSRYPECEIDWGSFTADGVALREALPVRFVKTPQASLFTRLARLQGRLEEMEARIAALPPESGAARSAIIAYYCLERHVDDLAWRLDGARPSLTILSLEVETALAA